MIECYHKRNVKNSRPKESFKEPNVSQQISDIRYYYYEEKRKALIDEVEDYIRGVGLRMTTTSFLRT